MAFAVLLLAAPADDPTAPARERMIRAIRSDGDDFDARVINALRATPRHRFVPASLESAAYENRPLPIGHGQTISQPLIVALMTDLLEVDDDDVVLEVGTGSGYQAAVLSPLVKLVHTVEIIEPLARQATGRLRTLGYKNVVVHHADGYDGWAGAAPYDAIIVTAAATHVPPPLIQQLKPGGRMVIPIGSPFATQSLMLVTKTADGKVRTRNMLPVAFVPLTRAK